MTPKPKPESKPELEVDEKTLIAYGRKYLERRLKRRRKSSRKYIILRKATLELKNGEKVTAFIIVGEAKGRNAKAIARQVRQGKIQLEPDEYYLVSRLTKLPSLAFEPYKRER